MTKTKKLRVLHEIYATIPDVACKGLCAESCSTVPVYPIELAELEAAAGRKLPTIALPIKAGAVLLGDEIAAPCPLLVDGRCSTHAQRPLLCRAFGSVEGLPCPHGCRPVVAAPADVMTRNLARIEAL